MLKNNGFLRQIRKMASQLVDKDSKLLARLAPTKASRFEVKKNLWMEWFKSSRNISDPT